MKEFEFKLKCLVVLIYRAKTEQESPDRLELNLLHLYNGYGQGNSLKMLAEAFLELNELGYEGDGIYLDRGYYESIDGMKLHLTRKK